MEKKSVICSQHWSEGKSENLYDPLDRICNEQYVLNHEKSVSKFAKLKAKKLVVARRSLNLSSRERRTIVRQEREKDRKITPVVDQVSGKDGRKYRLENEMLRNQWEELARKLQEKDIEMEISGKTLARKKKKIQKKKINELMKGQFTYMILKDKQDKFFYLTGLTTNEFDCLYECVEPSLYLIRYPDCRGGGNETKAGS